MNVLIVHAHNEPQSFTRALCDQACETLAGQGHAVQVSDLYAMNWNPVASAADFAERADPDYLVYALEQREGVKRQSLAADIQAELDKLLWADLLILNFPIYWFSVPAILKGWFDRVLVSGVCYGGKRFYDQGGLAGKKALVSLTLGGRQHMFGEGAVHGPAADPARHPGLCRHAGAGALRRLARAIHQRGSARQLPARLPGAAGKSRAG